MFNVLLPAHVDDIDDGRHLVEALYPLASLVALTADVEYAKVDALVREAGVGDAGGDRTAAQDVLIAGQVVGASNDAHTVQKVLGIVDQIVHVAVFGALFHLVALPQLLDGVPQLVGAVRRLIAPEAAEQAQIGHDQVLELHKILARQSHIQRLHVAQYGAYGVADVLLDVEDLRSPLVYAICGCVHDARLLEQRGLARLAGAEYEKFDGASD